jgi:hypothetical protein
METIQIIHIPFSVFVSLGVGASTIAISQFLYAFRDKQVDPSERSMLGVVYFVLRVAMVGILVTALLLTIMNAAPFTLPLSTFALTAFAMLGILYANALAMTLHLIPLRIAPAFQAGAWYTLGITNAARGADIIFSWTTILVLYSTLFAIFLTTITVVMKRYKRAV